MSFRAGFLGVLAIGAVATNAAAAEPVRTLDLRSLFDVAPTDVAARRDAYDSLVAAACLQGLANRAGPNLYLYYVKSVVDGSIDQDALWLDRLKDPATGGGVIDGRTITALTDLDAALDAYRPLISGLAVWDEKVPATVNAAFTAAGADDLIVVRWDASPTSLYQRLKAKGFVAKVMLVNDDGTSRFVDHAGTAHVPDLTRPTSQSAKADAYVWALEKYLKAGKLDPTELGWMLDARWISSPNDYSGAIQATNQLQITNRDWLVAARGMPFDLSPWGDVAATDDPSQPIGTDPGVLDEIVAGARDKAGDAPITVRGFFAWQFKYTTLEGLPAGHEPVMGEWTSVKKISPYAAGLDADAPGVATMANASFFRHVPLDELPEPQRRPTAEDLIGAGFLQGFAPNGGFEDDASSWTLHTTNYAVYTDDATSGARAHGGLRYLEVNTNKVGDDTQDNLYRDGRGAAVGEHVTMRAFVRAPGAPVDGQIVLWGLGGSNEQASTSFTADGHWKEVRVTLDVANAGHTSTRAQIYLKTNGANLDVDDVAFYAGNPADSVVEPANYAMWFVGDYDSAAWIEAFTPVTWDGHGRGVVPLAWDFSGHVATRFPPFFRRALATRTPRDFFVSADSGPGYGNPGEMDASARAIWANAGVVDARRLDTSCGWVLNPLGPLDATHAAAVTPYDGDGVLLMSSGGVSTPSIVDHAPVVALDNFGGTDVPSGESYLLGATSTPGTPVFKAFRVVLWKSDDLVTMSRDMVVNHGDRKLRFVDPFTFFYLARASMGGDDDHRASFRALSVGPAIVGAPVHVAVNVRNDGWETWRATGANPYRVGFHLADTPPKSRTLPSDATAYATRASLTADVPPGGEVTIAIDLPASPTPGKRTLQMDVVQEGVTWFETTGDVPPQVTIDVTSPSTDAGIDATPDAATDAPDAYPLDASADASFDAGNPGENASKGGCGCHVVMTHATTVERCFVALALAALVRRRKGLLRSRG